MKITVVNYNYKVLVVFVRTGDDALIEKEKQKTKYKKFKILFDFRKTLSNLFQS